MTIEGSVQATKLQRRILFSVLGLVLGLDAYAIWMALHIRISHPGVRIYDYFIEGVVAGVLLYALTLLLAIRRPEHRVTWVFAAMALTSALQQALGGYAAEALLAGPGDLPYGRIALASSVIAQTWFVSAFLLMVNLFPSGKPLPGRWRYVVWGLVPAALLGIVEGSTGVLELGGVTFPALFEASPPATFSPVAGVIAVWVIVGTIGHVIVRFVRSRGVERQQLKWFVFTFVIGVAILVIPWSEDDTGGSLVWIAVPMAILTAVAIAILRYRLYDIDRVISRTVSYVALVGFLGLVFFGSVTALTMVLPSENPVVIAASTLAVATLFNPARRRMQSWADRRFNRSRYVAEQVVEEFAARLRGRVDPDGVVDGWIGVVSETMQPSFVAPWVRWPTVGKHLQGR